ncbi:MAG: GNAT family N-acetyltransferase [Bauldia sp.]
MTVAAAADVAVGAAGLDSARGLSARVLTDADAIDAHLAAWRGLAEAARGFVVFQTADFVASWSRVFLAEKANLKVVLVYRDNTLAGLIPVEIRRRGMVTTARLAGAPVGQYDDVLIAPTADPASVVAAACEALRKEHGVDVVLLTRVRSDSALAAAESRSVAIGAPEQAPYADLGEDGAEAFMATLKKRVRRQLAKRQRQLAELGPCAFAQAADPDEAADWMRQALELKRDWLRRSGKLSRAFIDRRTAEFLIEAARAGARPREAAAPADGSRLILSRLTVGGRTAALEVGFVCRDTYHLYLGAFAPEFARFGPGNALTEAVVQACVEVGIRRYDMLAPDSRNKREWATDSVSVVDLALPLSGLGRLYVLIVHQALLPTARRLFYLLPVRLRSLIAARTLAL